MRKPSLSHEEEFGSPLDYARHMQLEEKVLRGTEVVFLHPNQLVAQVSLHSGHVADRLGAEQLRVR
jgi:hypothetical protein